MSTPRPRMAARWRSLARKAHRLPPVRILAMVFVVLFMTLLVSAPVELGFRALGLRLSTPPVMLIRIALQVAVAHWTYGRIVRCTERREADEVSLRGAPVELAAGVLLGAAIMTGVVTILWTLGHYEVVGHSAWEVAIPYLIQSVSTAYMEELLIRGILYRVLEEWQGTWIALALSALLFGLLHLANPNATFFSSIAIALEAGVLLGAAFALTRRIWLAVGVHFAWNFTQGGIFGVAVSGGTGRGILDGRVTGPELITGGAFGAEGSIVTVAIGMAVAAVLLQVAWWRGRIVPKPRPGSVPAAGMA